jgi:SAM-dependent methyltransferase
MDLNTSVLDRYSEGAKERQPTLCCPVSYDDELLKMLPREIVERDYGCGDPSRYVQEGDTVLDLGSGGGKVCYMAAKLVGEKGHVIGVDMNDDMLALARKYQAEMADKIGGDRVEFRKGFIQDLALDVAAMENLIAETPIDSADKLVALEDWKSRQRRESPLIADASVDLVISNCVLNLVDDGQKSHLVREIARVLKPGGRVAISDIVSDEAVPEKLKNDPELWSGCISGAFQEAEFLQAFVDAGFVAVGYDKWDAEPWQVVDGIEFRSVTLTATLPQGSECMDRGHAVIYKGPYASITDDEDHVFYRGERMAVCERTFKFLTEGPMQDDFIGIQPAQLWEPKNWCAPAGTRRPASQTKGGVQRVAETISSCC